MIPYFQSLLRDGTFRESEEGLVNLQDISLFACENIISYLEKDRLDLPVKSRHIEECLALGRYWQVEKYIDALLDKYISEYTGDKYREVDILNYITLMDRVERYKFWLLKHSQDILSFSRLHMLTGETIKMLVEVLSSEKKLRYLLFPLLRDWYLPDRDQQKVAVIVSLLEKIPLRSSSFEPKGQTRLFIENFPDPCLAMKVALWAVDTLSG